MRTSQSNLRFGNLGYPAPSPQPDPIPLEHRSTLVLVDGTRMKVAMAMELAPKVMALNPADCAHVDVQTGHGTWERAYVRAGHIMAFLPPKGFR